ncbi:GTPase IMAP family member 8-like isoform X2 [Hypomesus transpacificus]|uniref:GTPase IMAP family member 8-like isoform X2 n=1 Tax=Hypomesus transpacificus TaxID=137520 RepID=UPI001F082269|nr:GTPase IMAP family member 8-like isoform X2 [Hypomesus transpacificus]
MAGSVPPCFSELRMVLIRPDRCGLTVANTIFGKEIFEPGNITLKCENENREVNGRKVCLVKSPVWLRGYFLCDTPNIVKDELVLSVAQCPPGPHAFIIQIEANLPFTNLCRRSLQHHLELLGENVWNHTLVLFTNLDCQDNYTVEQHIESEGEPLRWLLNKCANRYHVFDSVQNIDQVEQMFKKVEEMVKENSGRHFEIDSALLSCTEQRRNEVDRKAKERHLRLQEERKQLKRQEELRIIMLGWVIAGKSITGNIILNMDEFGKEGHTTKSVKHCGELEEYRITMVDTPGWWKLLGAEFTSDSVKAEILEGVSMCSPYPHAFLLMIPADTSFTEEQKKVVQDNMKLLGEQVWSHTIVVFTNGKWLGDYTIEHHIESEGEALEWLIEKCGNRYHIFDRDVKDINNVPKLVRTIEEMVSKNNPYEASRETLSPLENRVSTAVQKEDEPLLKMVEVLYSEWDWKASEWFVIEQQLLLASGLLPISPGNQSMNEPLHFSNKRKVSKSVKQEEKIETLLGKYFGIGKESLSELMEKTLKNFDKDNQESLGVDSVDSGMTELKPQWKELIEREWIRRENKLMYEVIHKLSIQWENYGKTSELDLQGRASVNQKVSSWLHSHGYHSGAGSVETPESSDREQLQ